MRLYRFLVIIALLMGIAQCFFFDIVNSVPTDTVLDQPEPAVEESVAEVEGQIENIQSREFTQNADYKCGAKWGRCPMGTCCSASGYCGTSQLHCRSPDCLIDWGQCDADRTPEGPPTKDILRPSIGKVPYGPQEIRSCTVPGTVALTFDDGPTRYTGELLDLLDKYEAPATFFVTGVNNGKGQIDDPSLPWAPLIERMLLSGHQIASHTWSHEDLSKITPTQRRDQMEKNEAALRNIMGSFPTYMRPPFSKCHAGSGCREAMGDMGYHIILYDIDTDDRKNDSPDHIQLSKDLFDNALAKGNPATKSWLVIGHDAHEQTVHNLTEHMLKTIIRLGYRPVTVGDCLQDPRDNWYRIDNRWPGHKNKKKPPRKGPQKGIPQQVSVDGSCGSNYTCLGSHFGLCCSSVYLCGNTTLHCGVGCRKDSGYCTVETPSNGDPWDPKFPGKSGKSEGESDFRAVGTAALTSLLLALIAAMFM
ncbi:Glycoside hydrolase/deacetylase beta/alpha-barrel [Penicillium atrosanguineum]|nr:Glycoside hydrolase/deacetylase beta/alpha-barrel [Penicillium atrosanguineum]